MSGVCIEILSNLSHPKEKCNGNAFHRLTPSVHKWEISWSCTIQNGIISRVAPEH